MNMEIKRKTQRVYPELKVKELLDAIGTDKEIAELLRSYGYEAPPLPSIRGWRSRNSVPVVWLPILMDWAINKGEIKKPEQLVKALV
jgi:hypothetical protein